MRRRRPHRATAFQMREQERYRARFGGRIARKHRRSARFDPASDAFHPRGLVRSPHASCRDHPDPVRVQYLLRCMLEPSDGKASEKRLPVYHETRSLSSISCRHVRSNPPWAGARTHAPPKSSSRRPDRSSRRGKTKLCAGYEMSGAGRHHRFAPTGRTATSCLSRPEGSRYDRRIASSDVAARQHQGSA